MGYGERQAVNAIIQGSAADIVRRAMLLSRQFEGPIRLLAQVHDELIWEHFYPDYEDTFPIAAAALERVKLLKVLKHVAENPGYDLTVPLVFEPSFCTSWAEKGGKPVVLDAEAYQPTIGADEEDEDAA